MRELTLGSLFDGIGGFCYAATLTGRIKPIWAAEIEPSCIDITRYRFPEVMHVGSVTELKGNEIQPVDIITFGSPCQDLSIAGARKGLKGNRSSLFLEAIRIIEEMRLATNGKYPTFIIWENVPGAFSSRDGADFRTVLEKITKTNIPMPASGKWAITGMVRGGEVDTAWRVLDAQYWGVPQRRKRIYLIGDFGGQRAGEILFKSESLLGYTPKSKEQRAETAGQPTDSIRAESRQGAALGLDFAHADSVVRTFTDKTPTLLQNMGSAGGQIPCVMHEERTVAGFIYNQGGEGKGLGFKDGVVYIIRRLIPVECERLQGYPDDWTRYGADGNEIADTARYKAIGNSICVFCAERVYLGILDALDILTEVADERENKSIL